MPPAPIFISWHRNDLVSTLLVPEKQRIDAGSVTVHYDLPARSTSSKHLGIGLSSLASPQRQERDKSGDVDARFGPVVKQQSGPHRVRFWRLFCLDNEVHMEALASVLEVVSVHSLTNWGQASNYASLAANCLARPLKRIGSSTLTKRDKRFMEDSIYYE